VGLPFVDGGRCTAGVDCWGLVRLVLTERAGLDLPFYDGVSASDGATVRDIVRQEAAASEWIQVDLAAIKELDVVLMRGPGGRGRHGDGSRNPCRDCCRRQAPDAR
jgi:cell wall-associated NlpC family hydrolase